MVNLYFQATNFRHFWTRTVYVNWCSVNRKGSRINNGLSELVICTVWLLLSLVQKVLGQEFEIFKTFDETSEIWFWRQPFELNDDRLCTIQQIDTPVGPEIEEESDSIQDEYENDFLWFRIKKRLLPLLLKPDVLESDYWKDADSKEVESVMSDILLEIREHREDMLSDILGVHHQPLSPNTKNDRRVCPTYQNFAIPLD